MICASGGSGSTQGSLIGQMGRRQGGTHARQCLCGCRVEIAAIAEVWA